MPTGSVSTIEQAIGDPKYGDQNTDGSNSIRDFYDALREAGATARLMLERAAAAQWGVPASECQARNHQVVHAAAAAASVTASWCRRAAQAAGAEERRAAASNRQSEFRYIGKGVPIVDLDDIVHRQGDIRHRRADARDGLRVDRAIAGDRRQLKSYDDKEARTGARRACRRSCIHAAKPPYGFQALGGVAVIADSTWAAMQGRKKLKIEWDPADNATYDSDAYKKHCTPPRAARKRSCATSATSMRSSLSGGTSSTKPNTTCPCWRMSPWSRRPLWPITRTAKSWSGRRPRTRRRCRTRWRGAADRQEERRSATCTLLGGGFGRKSKPDYVAEAALLSKKVGKPVKVAWTPRGRHPVRLLQRGGSDVSEGRASARTGKPTAWLQRIASSRPSRPPSMLTAVYGDAGHLARVGSTCPSTSPTCAPRTGRQTHVRIGWLRSVANIYHALRDSVLHRRACRRGKAAIGSSISSMSWARHA